MSRTEPNRLPLVSAEPLSRSGCKIGSVLARQFSEDLISAEIGYCGVVTSDSQERLADAEGRASSLDLSHGAVLWLSHLVVNAGWHLTNVSCPEVLFQGTAAAYVINMAGRALY